MKLFEVCMSDNRGIYFIGTNFRGEKFSRIFAVSRFFSRNSRKFLPRIILFASIREKLEIAYESNMLFQSGMKTFYAAEK